MEGAAAAHIVDIRFERGDRDLAGPAAIALLARPADLGAQFDAFAVGPHGDDLELGDEVLHQGISVPSWERNRPESLGVSRSITLRNPRTDASGDNGAPAPPMSVRTQPGLSATTMIRLDASVAARPLPSMLSAALLVEYGSVMPLDSPIEPRRLDMSAIVLRSLAATWSTSASASAAGPSKFTRSTSSHDWKSNEPSAMPRFPLMPALQKSRSSALSPSLAA